MEKLYKLNNILAKIWKLDKLQVFVYPMICFAILASGIVVIAGVQFLSTIIK